MKIVRLTESDLTRLVKRVIIESKKSKKSKERDDDETMMILAKDGLHPSYSTIEDFEASSFYDSEKSYEDYVEALKDFIKKRR